MMDKDEARQAPDAVDSAEETTKWKPTSWVVWALGIVYAVLVMFAAWGRLGAALVMMVVLIGIMILFRGKIEAPVVKERPGEGSNHPTNWWMASSFIWIVLSAVVPSELPWLGVVFGLIAGAHLFFVLRSGRFYVWAS